MVYSSIELHMLLCTNKAVMHEGETPIWGDNLWAGFDLESHEACATLQDTTDKVRPDCCAVWAGHMEYRIQDTRKPGQEDAGDPGSSGGAGFIPPTAGAPGGQGQVPSFSKSRGWV